MYYNSYRPSPTLTSTGVQADSSSYSNGAAGSSIASSSAGPARPLEPKFRSLADLERNVDRTQAESLKMLRVGRREGHRIITAPRDFFHRHLLVPECVTASFRALWTSCFLILLWSTVAGIFDVIFTHCFIRTEQTFLQDLSAHLSWSTVFRPWTLLGTVLIAVASLWNYLHLVRIPPPLFPNWSKKLIEFLRTLMVNGPCALVCVAVLCLRPTFQVVLQSAGLTENGVVGSELSRLPIPMETSLTDVFLWEVVFKNVLPAFFLMATFVSVNFVHFWLGDFFIGVVKVPPHGPSLFSIQNPVVFVRMLCSTVYNAILDAIQPVSVLPGQNFWIVTAVLMSLPILFPVADVFRLWLQYHFLAFAVLHAWKLNLLQMRATLAKLHRIRDLEMSDWIALPSVLSNLRMSGWWWADHLEMQLRAGFLEQLKSQPNFLAGFLRLRIPTKDLNNLDEFVKFWLQPIQEFSRYFHTVQFLAESERDPRSRRLDFLLWTARQLQALHDLYAHSSPPNLLDQDFTAFPFASVVKPSVRVIEHVRCVTLFATRARAVDSKNVLTASYGAILEQLAALSVILEKGSEKFEDLGDGRLFQQYPNMEPCIRFYIKSYRQLQHLTKMNLAELVSVLAKDLGELRFKEFPELAPYVDSLLQQSRSR